MRSIRKEKTQLIFPKTHRSATIIFWNIKLNLQLAVCILQDLHSSILAAWPPHQRPNFFLFNALKFHIPTIYPNICFTFDTQTTFFLYSNKPTNNYYFLPLFKQTLLGDFLGCERKSTTKLMPPLWRRDADVVGELYLNILYSDVLVCFPFLLGVAEFCIDKISMELCGFVCGFHIFVQLICGFLSISFREKATFSPYIFRRFPF